MEQRTIWLDKNRKVINIDEYLVNDNGEKFKVTTIRNNNLYLLKEDNESIVKLNKSYCRSPYNSIDLKKNQYQLDNYKIYK